MMDISLLCTVLFSVASAVDDSTGLVGRLPIYRSVNMFDVTKQTTPLIERWFDQHLDHFSTADTRLWKQRYFLSDKFYKPGGPIFLFVGPESPLNPVFVENGAHAEYASVYNALIIAVEHRYYGKSRPTVDLSTENLKYLTIEQALEDLAELIVTFNKDHNITSPKWVAFGGSYPGLLAVWLRYKFPHLVIGAIGSSAPVDRITTNADYFQTIGEVLRTVPGCYQSVANAFHDVRRSFESETGSRNLENLFRLCPFNRRNKMDRERLQILLLTDISMVVQMNNDNLAFLGPSPINSVDAMCGILTNETVGSPLERLAEFERIKTFNFTILTTPCTNVSFKDYTERGQDTDFDHNMDGDGRQWKYQMCTQVGLNHPAMAAQGNDQPFGDAYDQEYYVKVCQGYFGSNFSLNRTTHGIIETIRNYGGKKIKATQVIYTQGSCDPYHKYGFVHNPNPGAYAFLIPGVGHVADMLPSAVNDTIQMKATRMKIQQIIGQWISSEKIIIG